MGNKEVKEMEIYGLNWTKVGLKVLIGDHFHAFDISLNWTKVGLKDNIYDVLTLGITEFELD